MPRCAQGRKVSLASPHRATLQPCSLETKVGRALVVRGENSSVSVSFIRRYVESYADAGGSASRSSPGRL
jgi:hypothetical protein